MKRKLSGFLAAVVCLSLLLTGCNGGGGNNSSGGLPSIPDIIASLTTEQVVLKAMDGLRKDGAYKTIDGTITMNVPKDKSDGSYVTGDASVDFKGVFENKKLSADITYYTVYEFEREYKEIYLSYIREDDIYEQKASVSTNGDSGAEYNAATKESLTKLAKSYAVDTYSHWTIPETIKYFFNGFIGEEKTGAFGIIDCLKASRTASKTLEDNIAKKLVSLWGVTATRQQDKTYVVTLDVNKAIDGTFELCDTIADYLVKNKDKTVRTLIEDEVSPARLFINSILYGVSGTAAEKILTDISKLYGWAEQLNDANVVATEEDTALTYLTKFLDAEDGNNLAFGDRTIEEIINYQPMHDLFYSYDGETETLDLAGWKDFKKMIKDGIGEDFRIDFKLNSDYIIESIKGGCDTSFSIVARFDGEIYFNREVKLEDESELIAGFSVTPTGESCFSKTRWWHDGFQEEDNNPELSNAKFEYSVKDGVITIGLYLTDGTKTKVFEREISKVSTLDLYSEYFWISDENMTITNKNGETVLSYSDGVYVEARCIGIVENSGTETINDDWYVSVSVRVMGRYLYSIYFKGTAKEIRLKDYKES
ncbi:MAG TPA: hypothetical protein DDY77_04100 [Clostridiales bacterium]|mgnify:FL=1|nr:hypothetical protein [Clostridiales bacterium]